MARKRSDAHSPLARSGRPVSRRTWIGLAVAGVAGAVASPSVIRAFGGGQEGAGAHLAVYKSPSCGCCGKWIEHAEAAGFRVTVEDVPDVTPLKNRHRIPRELWSCHTTVVDGYAVEGHVPADLITRLLRERPDVAGIAVPGMPQGSPGMEQGMPKETYAVLTFTADGRTATYAIR